MLERNSQIPMGQTVNNHNKWEYISFMQKLCSLRGVRKGINYSEPCSNTQDKEQFSLGCAWVSCSNMRCRFTINSLFCDITKQRWICDITKSNKWYHKIDLVIIGDLYSKTAPLTQMGITQTQLCFISGIKARLGIIIYFLNNIGSRLIQRQKVESTLIPRCYKTLNQRSCIISYGHSSLKLFLNGPEAVFKQQNPCSNHEIHVLFEHGFWTFDITR